MVYGKFVTLLLQFLNEKKIVNIAIHVIAHIRTCVYFCLANYMTVHGQNNHMYVATYIMIECYCNAAFLLTTLLYMQWLCNSL